MIGVPKPPKAEPRARQRNSTLPVPSTPLKSKGRIKPKARKASERDRIYGPKAYREWLHHQPCAVVGIRGDIECVHVVTGGVGRKADWTLTVPMARELHWELHRIGVRSFEAKHGVSLLALAAKTQRKWQSHTTKAQVAS